MKIYSKTMFYGGLLLLIIFVVQLFTVKNESWLTLIIPFFMGSNGVITGLIDPKEKEDERSNLITLKTYTLTLRIIMLLILTFFIISWWSIFDLNYRMVFFFLVWVGSFVMQSIKFYFQKTM